MDPSDSFRTDSEPLESSRIQKSTERTTSDRNKCVRIETHMDTIDWQNRQLTIGIFQNSHFNWKYRQQ